MVKIVLDPALGNQMIVYDFRKERDLAVCIPKLMDALKLPKDDPQKFVLQLKSSGKFVAKVDELCKKITAVRLC